VRALALVALSAALAGHAAWRTFRADGVSVGLPPGWYATATPLTAVTAPRQVLAVASYRLPRSDAASAGCEPRAAIARLPANGAFVFGWDYGPIAGPFGPSKENFPPKPLHFRLSAPVRTECFPANDMIAFRAGGQAFQLQVVLGRNAGAALRATVLRILDSFKVTR
jgi:hypothetical protein